MNKIDIDKKLFGWHDKTEKPIIDKHILIKPSTSYVNDDMFPFTYIDINNIYFVGKLIKSIFTDNKPELTIYSFNADDILDTKEFVWDEFVEEWIYLDDIKELI